MAHLWLVEDEPDAGQVLAGYLRKLGHSVAWFQDGEAATAALPTPQPVPELAILDLMLPGQDGYQVLTHLRQAAPTQQLPVILLTARDREQDEIRGLDLGADVYLRKPVSLRVIQAHVERLLKRQPAQPTNDPLVYGPLKLDPQAQRAWLDGQPLDLTATETRILALFLRHPARIFARHDILRVLEQEADRLVQARTVDAHIKNLRAKLAPHDGLVRTFRGLGYGLPKD